MQIKKNIILSCFCFILVNALLSTNANADGDNREIPKSHPVALFTDAIPATDSPSPNKYFSKKSVDEVKAFFDSGRQSTDRFEPYSNQDEKGTVLYTTNLGKRFDLVTISTKATQESYAGQAFGQLQALSMRGMHKENEFKEIESKYSILKSSYFKKVKDQQDHTKSEAEIIYRKYLKIAHPDLEKSSGKQNESEEYKAGKAKAIEMRKQMQEMKAKGDIAGMMNMAQNSKGPQIPKEGQKYMDAMNKDTWATWVECLDEMSKASFQTSITYKSGIAGN